ncbi:TPA: NAD(P)H-hydrate dehydratase [Candidatus Avigastranaerophilus faecigallinarum]|nr:NAD(P)H-hydrate dehydratase [Candidatus Avigastranaerophilus faecigallinarum]
MVKLIDKKLVFGKLPKRIEESNKATFGRVLNISGSKPYIGAALLSSISALKVGAGYVSLACPTEIVPVIASMAPELTFVHLKSDNNGIISSENTIDNLYSYNVVSMGCGITANDEVKKFVFYILNNLNKAQKVVIDADGINLLSNHKGEISLKNMVITPHPRELSRLLNVSVEEIVENREKYARITSQTYECITVLKGHNSIVTNGEKIFINQSGSSALAKAGTGDVLTGIIAGLLAQKLSPLDAAIIGTYLHGLAGDIAAADLTKYSVLASDVIDYLPFALKMVLSEE